MAGSPIKYLKNYAFKEALLAGRTPEEFFAPIASELEKMAKGGDLAAIKEVVDRIDGKVTQEIKVDRTDTTVDADLLGSMGELLKLVRQPEEKEIRGEVVEQVKS